MAIIPIPDPEPISVPVPDDDGPLAYPSATAWNIKGMQVRDVVACHIAQGAIGTGPSHLVGMTAEQRAAFALAVWALADAVMEARGKQ